MKLALDGVGPEDMIDKLLSFTEGISAEWEDAVSKIRECLEWEDEERAISHLGDGWVGEEAVSLALYCFLRYPTDYAKAVLRGVNTDGDSDSIACITGSISGAYLGVGAIPQYWISRVEDSEYIWDLSTRLAEKRSNLKSQKLSNLGPGQ